VPGDDRTRQNVARIVDSGRQGIVNPLPSPQMRLKPTRELDWRFPLPGLGFALGSAMEHTSLKIDPAPIVLGCQ
jgi:hypothetical protein